MYKAVHSSYLIIKARNDLYQKNILCIEAKLMNYGEEISYWYFRLNGFFPIVNFVVHRTEEIKYSTDVDLLAVRFPNVYEAVGGKSNDWDRKLLDQFDKDAIIGVICEVKTGDYNLKDLFKSESVKYAIARFGFRQNIDGYIDKFEKLKIVEFSQNKQKYQIAKILISNNEKQGDLHFMHFHLSNLGNFISDRILKYKDKKWQDRMFFPSNYLASIIDRIYHE